ncbi:DUF6933 domain-containing protein [Paenibacillus etheri]|uniref:DUF6933 domain-containing protein n=1 Tax=Paenibacillus etheri TaxID=1306852 RepID=A0A0W1B4J0_9BACL|nr:hypothetical protein [Paenibacillus etheri]KTD88473.1 hypothetical protein UQ64_03890 [Paenibacillus etheri]
MLVLRYTQKLLKDMKVAPVEVEEISSFFSWHVNIMQLRKKHILFVHDESRLCIVLDGIRSGQADKLVEKFRIELKEYLLQEGFKKQLINQYLLEAGEIAISRTNNKSVLGTMNEITLYNSVAQSDFNSLFERNKWLNTIIYKPIDYKEPINVFRESLRGYYS